MKINKRQYQPSLDEVFLYKNYVSVRWDEVDSYPWSLEEKNTFLQMQFHLRQGFYSQQYPNLETFILSVGVEKIGHYMVSKTLHEIRLVDFYIVPTFRSKGIGTNVLREMMNEVRANDQTLSLSVFYQNGQARRLYEKLGFVLEKEEIPYIRMKWSPSLLTETIN